MWVQNLYTEISVAKTLLDKVKTAVVERGEQVSHLDEISSNTDAAHIAEWTHLVEAWENGAEFNPFEVHCHCTRSVAIPFRGTLTI